ncbi:MAG: transcription-repair coupling factor [Desulfovibrio sp.]|nr:transcription-repair coupling factor [Desulfovibrio sp.]
MGTRCRLACEAVSRGRYVVLLAGNKEEFATAKALLDLFTPELSSEGPDPLQPAWNSPCLQLPSLGQWRNREGWSVRLAAFYGLILGGARCVVATFESVLLRYMPRDFFDTRTLTLQKGMEFSPELILDQALEWGYVRTPMVDRPGDVARRGDILDIFPTGHARPVRLEFFGDMVEEIRCFDSESQRTVAHMDEMTLLPISPLALGRNDKANALRLCEAYRDSGKLDRETVLRLQDVLKGDVAAGDAEVGRPILPGLVFERASLVEDWFPKDALWLLPEEDESAMLLEEHRAALKEALEEGEGIAQPANLVLRKSSMPAPWNAFARVHSRQLALGVERDGVDLPERAIRSFAELFPQPGAMDRPWQSLCAGLRQWQTERRQVLLSFASQRSRAKFLKLAEQDGILPHLRYAPDGRGLFALVSAFRQGVDFLWDGCLVLGEDILSPRAERVPLPSTKSFKGLAAFDDIVEGDLLVHREYGIGRFLRLDHIEFGDCANDFLVIEYSGKDKLYIPADRIGTVQRFQGPEGVNPVLDKLGGNSWARGQERARKAIEKIAADLVEMYAYRKVTKGFRYAPLDDLYSEFEATFGFEETPDQAKAISEVLEDMDKAAPMDRLICGDVGFGKTEVALRAAFRAAADSRQVALLCPTTVLAEQHYQTFRSRLSGFPVTVRMLSRFVPMARQKEIIHAASKGTVDILIGTHRILSNDVVLPNLALLVLDEEQRFGVRHKEKLKAIKKNVDVLTLTATPIPRTLQLSMSGIRELSLIETPPQDRKPVSTAILHRDDAVLANVLDRELQREGQVFWVHNRVKTLDEAQAYVRSLAPKARIGTAHGQMREGELERAMREFWHGELDILVCTAIVESGLDFPRANTLVVDQAQLFGLGQLYQLRGRVGRSDRQAYAYFLVPDAGRLSETAMDRLRVILDMDYLGAGFKVAMEDLRIRGAGNILGEAQSGHMTRVGLDLYLEMLEEEVARLKGTSVERNVDTEMNIVVPAHIPATYIEDGRERLRCYKMLTSATDGAAREDVALSMRDRFGPFPEELKNFLAVLDFKQFLTGLKVQRADIHVNRVRLLLGEAQKAIDGGALVALVQGTRGATLTPSCELTLPLGDPFGVSLQTLRGRLEEVRLAS